MADIAVWTHVNATASGILTAYTRGALLPDPADAAETAEREELRRGGAIRLVTSYAAEGAWTAALTAAADAAQTADAAAAGVNPSGVKQIMVAGRTYALEPPA